MNTTLLLLAQFGQADIPLSQVAEHYLGLSERKASDMASRCKLPFPAYKAGSNKSPWLVRVTDLAAYLDKAREQAGKDWENRRID